MTGQRVARRYAQALVELAEREGRADEAGGEVERVARAFDSSAELRGLMFSPGVVKDVKRRVLREILRRAEVSGLGGRFFHLLLDKDRLRHLPSICKVYRDLADERAGRVRARVRSAFALSPEEEAALRGRLSAATGKEVVLEVETDRALLGGLTAQLGSAVWDGSLRSHLESLREKLVGPM